MNDRTHLLTSARAATLTVRKQETAAQLHILHKIAGVKNAGECETAT